MRAIPASLLSVATLLVLTGLLTGCVTSTADGIQIQPLAGGNPSAVLGIDPATYVVLDLERSGGLAGVSARAQLFLDGHVLLERQGEDPVTFQLSSAEQSQLTAALEAADFYRNAAQSEPPAEVLPDAFQYRIQRRGVLLQGEVVAQDGDVPTWLEPLLPLLSNVLLAPEPARTQPYRPTPIAAASTITPGVAAPAAPPIVLLEFTRSLPGEQARVLVNLDRSYSVAREGQVEEGELAREEMATLIRLLEDANLKERAGDYTPDEPCAGCARYEVTYRNLLGGATVRGQEGALPTWLRALIATLVESFMETEQVAAVATPDATPMTAGSPTPGPAAMPSPATPVDTVADLLSALAAQGAQVEETPGRVVKPYLSMPGVVLRVDGQPLQVFQYPDAAALAADVAGLAPNASSIDGRPLAWPAAPHFWRQGGLLALAVTDDQGLVELISSVLGAQFAGR